MTGPRQTRGTDATKLRERFAWLNRFSDEELREISFCYEGERLKKDDLYVDISHPERGVMQGHAGESVPPESCLVLRSQVSEPIWNKLVSESRQSS